jgi:hypothetical protein
LQNALYTTLFLDARSRMLTASPPTEEGTVHYDPNRQGSSGRASFAHRFVRDTEITGGMTLKLWVSTSNGEDLDLFVLLRKFDADGLETFFYGYNGFAKDGVAKGWLRVSHRARFGAQPSGPALAQASSTTAGPPGRNHARRD